MPKSKTSVVGYLCWYGFLYKPLCVVILYKNIANCFLPSNLPVVMQYTQCVYMNAIHCCVTCTVLCLSCVICEFEYTIVVFLPSLHAGGSV